MHIEPGKPPQTCKGTARVRGIGELWVVAESTSTFMNMPMTGVQTLGYDAEAKKFVGTWICSCSSYLWKQEGTLDSSARILTLETEGPCPCVPGKISKFKEVFEFKNKDHRVFTSSIQGEDGKWSTVVTINYRRKS